LELLLNAPWQITLGAEAGFPVGEPIIVRVPNASSYLAQKLLVHQKREPRERAKHILYIHDTIQTFGRALPRLKQEWADSVRPLLLGKAAAKVVSSAEKLFADVTDPIRAASIEAAATGRSVDPEEIRAACQAGLRQVFA
jgi:hypothetical protein